MTDKKSLREMLIEMIENPLPDVVGVKYFADETPSEQADRIIALTQPLQYKIEAVVTWLRTYKRGEKMGTKEIMEIIGEADCNPEVCFRNSKGEYQIWGWARNLIEVTFKAGREASIVDLFLKNGKENND